jgi:hypothetical protein
MKKHFFSTHLRLSRLLLPLLFLLPLTGRAQFYGRGFGGYGGGNRGYQIRDPDEILHMQEMDKVIDPNFKNDVFTFPRLIYPYEYGGGRMWDDDSPDAELNLEWRLFQVTCLKVHPGYTYINITPQEVAKYPFIYVTAKYGMDLTDDNAKVLRNYMLNGGFVMAEDFWGDTAWSAFYQQVKRIFPDREPKEIGLEHPIFHVVFDFKALAQMPSVGTYERSGQAYDPADYSQDHDPHYFEVTDDKGRMMMLICLNNHYGDGWEHEGDDEGYFDLFSKAQAYPMFINILFYAMTH